MLPFGILVLAQQDASTKLGFQVLHLRPNESLTLDTENFELVVLDVEPESFIIRSEGTSGEISTSAMPYPIIALKSNKITFQALESRECRFLSGSYLVSCAVTPKSR